MKMPARTPLRCATRTKNCRALAGRDRGELQLFERARRDNGDLHPALDRIRMDSLGIAKGMVGGDIVCTEGGTIAMRAGQTPPLPRASKRRVAFQIQQNSSRAVLVCRLVVRDSRRSSLREVRIRSNQNVGSRAASLRKNMVKKKINDHAGDGDVHPDRPCPARDLFVAVELAPGSAVEGR